MPHPLLAPPSAPAAAAASIGVRGHGPLQQVDDGGQYDGEVEGGQALLDNPEGGGGWGEEKADIMNRLTPTAMQPLAALLRSTITDTASGCPCSHYAMVSTLTGKKAGS